MGCVQSKQGADVLEADPSAKDVTKLTIYATAGEASEAEQQRTAENGFKTPFRRISNKIIPVIDYLANRASNHTSVVLFRDSHGHLGGANDSAPGLAYLRYCPTAPKRWKKGEAIGSGSFGNVFVGLNLDTGELLAAKEVAVTSAEGEGKLQEAVAQLEQEVQLLSSFRHPNIVQYVGTVREDGYLYIFLELIRGGSIASLLSKFGPLDERVIRIYTRQLLTGLGYLHSQHTVHRDIKGANLLVETTGRLKLADFGMAKQLAEQVSVSRSFKGSAHWMAPEVVRQQGLGTAADIWSVGCTVLEMATGKPPWQQCATQVQAIFKIASSNELPAIPDSLSPEAAEFVLLCLQRDPALRPSAQQLLQHSWMHFSDEELAQIPALAVAQPAAAEPAAATWASRGGPCQACGATGPCTCSRAMSARMARRSSSRRRSKQQQQQARQQEGAGGSLPGTTASHAEQQAGAGCSLPPVTSDTASQLEALLLGNPSTARRPTAAGTDSEGQPDEPVLPSAFKASAILVLPPVRMPQGQLLPPVQVISHHMHLARQHSGTSTISSLLG